MKIKILKTKQADIISEKKLIISAFNSDYVINSLLDPNSEESIFNKKTIFYDLETNGFLPDAYVHQIAALEYDLKPQMEQIFKGQKPDAIAGAKDGVIVKARFDLKDFKPKDEKTIESRIEFYKDFYKNSKASVDNVSRDTVTKYITKKRKSGKLFINFEINKESIPIIVGAHITRNSEERNKLAKSLKQYLSFLKKDADSKKAPPLTKTIQSYVDSTLNPSGALRYPEASGEEADLFFKTLYLLMNALTNSPYAYGSKRGGSRYALRKELEKLTKDLTRSALRFTYAENKMFTEYDNFPLDKYKSLQRGDLPSEKEGLLIFLDYLKSIGNENYVLIGHNINSFDNKVIVARSQFNNIKGEALKSFQDSMSFDTLPLLRLYVKQLEYYNKLYKEKLSDLSPEQQDLSSFAKQKIETLREIYPSLKAKLDGMMKLFEETRDYEQTHTADDDCEQLARVFIGATLDMFEMMSTYNDALRILDMGEATVFDTKEPSLKDLKDSIVSKMMEDSENYFYSQGKRDFLSKYPFMDKGQDNPKVTKKNIKSARRAIYDDFAKALLAKKSKDVKNFKPADMMKLNTADVGKQFIKWMESRRLGEISKQAVEYITRANEDYRFSALTRKAYIDNIASLLDIIKQGKIDRDQILNLMYDEMTQEQDEEKQSGKLKQFKQKLDALVATNQSLNEEIKKYKIRILK